MTETRPSARRGPVVLNGMPPRPRRAVRPRDALFGAEALGGPLPGRLLVLLSRLHRAEDARGDEGDKGS